MAEQNVATVHAIYEHLNRGDAESAARLCADDFELDMTERVFNSDTYEGAADLHRFLDGVHDAWASYHWTVEETRVSGDAVVAMLHCRARGHGEGPEVDWRVAWVWRFRDCVAVSARFHRDPAQALDAAGLRGE